MNKPEQWDRKTPIVRKFMKACCVIWSSNFESRVIGILVGHRLTCSSCSTTYVLEKDQKATFGIMRSIIVYEWVPAVLHDK